MSKKYVFSVQSVSEPLRLDTFLSKQDIFSSRSQVQNLIKKKSSIYKRKNAKRFILGKRGRFN